MSNNALILNAGAPLVLADNPEVQAFAKTIKLLLPGGSKLSDDEALAGAQYAKTTGLNPFIGEFYIMPGIGVTPGYKGELRQRPIDKRFRPLTEDEEEWHDIDKADKAIVCEAWDPAEAARARAEGRQPAITEGVGIVRKAEQWLSYTWKTAQSGKRYRAPIPEAEWTTRADPPTGRSWGWVAQNRALKDALRHMGIEVEESAEEVFLQARASGLNMTDPPEAARLTPAQARAWVRSAETVATVAAQPIETTLAHAAQNVLAMRGPAGDDPLGIDSGPETFPVAAPPEEAAQIIDRLRREAHERDSEQPEQATAAQMGMAYAGLTQAGFVREKAHIIVGAIFPGGLTTRAECATLFYWLNQVDGKKRQIKAQAVEEAATVLAYTVMQPAEELPFTDEPEPEGADA